MLYFASILETESLDWSYGSTESDCLWSQLFLVDNRKRACFSLSSVTESVLDVVCGTTILQNWWQSTHIWHNISLATYALLSDGSGAVWHHGSSFCLCMLFLSNSWISVERANDISCDEELVNDWRVSVRSYDRHYEVEHEQCQYHLYRVSLESRHTQKLTPRLSPIVARNSHPLDKEFPIAIVYCQWKKRTVPRIAMMMAVEWQRTERGTAILKKPNFAFGSPSLLSRINWATVTPSTANAWEVLMYPSTVLSSAVSIQLY